MSGPYDFDSDPFGFTAGPVAGARRPMAAVRGAENLLVKAAAAWSDGLDDRAALLIDRAAAMAYDRHEEWWPAPQAAHLLLFELLTHTLETGGPREWFAAVEATVASIDDDAQLDALCDALGAVISDWHLEPDLDRRLRTLVRGRGSDDERWMDETLGPAEVRAGTESTLRLAVRLCDELERRDLCSHLVPEYW